MQHSKTYTVLKPLEDKTLTQEDIAESASTVAHSESVGNKDAFKEAIKLIKTISLSTRDLQTLRQACALVDENFEENILLKLLESSR